MRKTLYAFGLALLALTLPGAREARADAGVFCPAGAAVSSKFVQNTSHFPVKLEVTLPGSPAIVITDATQLPPGAVCRVAGLVTFLADASTDNGKTYHRVMSRSVAQSDGSWLAEAAPDSFNGNFAYSAQFAIAVKPH
jgi:hypothetical protein